MNIRKIGSNILAVMLIATVMLSAIAMPLDVSAASKKKAKCTISLLNINSDTVLKKGKRLKVVYRAVSSNGKKVKVRFKSSNRKIAKVSRKGVIKAKRNGKVKIIAYAYIKGKKCGKKTVTIKIGKPVSEKDYGKYVNPFIEDAYKDFLKDNPVNLTDKERKIVTNIGNMGFVIFSVIVEKFKNS